MTHRPVAAAFSMLAFLLLVVGCAAGKQADGTGGAAGAASVTSSPSASESTLQPTLEITVNLQEGRVLPPPSRIKTTRGTVIRLTANSDVADTIHVHGYEVKHPIRAGERSTVEWIADQVGIFEIEAHDSELQLGQIEVR